MMGREQTVGEEVASALSHGAGALASVAAVPVLVVAAVGRSDPWQIVGGAVFGATLVLLYLASTVYHALPPSRQRAKQVARRLDHAAIYLLIAGTYTPFTLGALRGPWGWSLLVVVWALAGVGVGVKTARGIRAPRLSTALYLGMGWLVLVAVRPLAAAVGPEGLTWIVAGGLCYTLGVGFYAWERLRYNHFVWHLFVLAGSACHFVAVLRHAA
jgi:hemolysin III